MVLFSYIFDKCWKARNYAPPGIPLNETSLGRFHSNFKPNRGESAH
jgi:hypothetical protein